ncbi:hypothetical protein [Natronomonas salsuginis]|uniref:hypothetical protein n=1 Tax=Natronomonas salsuginis TaxID=2217661 RepID=UPI001C9E44C2|nr:hypothetical protein [Natronomonas salsuginis]
MDDDARDGDRVTRDSDPGARDGDIDIETIRSRLEALERAVDHPDERREVRRTIGLID